MGWRSLHARRVPPGAVLVLLLAAAPAAGQLQAGLPGPVLRYETLVNPGDRVICVGRRFLEAGSDSLLVSGRPLTRGKDYQADLAQGCFLLQPSALGDSLSYPAALVIYYRPLPLSLEPVYTHRDLAGNATPVSPGAGPGDRGSVAGAAPPAAGGAGPSGSPAVPPADSLGRAFPVRPTSGPSGGASEGVDLDLTGSKTFTAELGSNRDLTLRQTLDLKVTGRVSRDVTLKAILSDRNLPFQPEGNTAELAELDRVLIEMEGPGARVGLGDQDLAIDSGSFARFSRRLQGLSARVTRGGGQVNLVGASERGEYRSLEFLGTDGKQGPYPLSDRGGGRGIVVVAGSERVWVDGVEMQRGLDRDYTIDYGQAVVTFTPRRIITAQSRIAVDYEFSAVGYRRSLYLASASGRIGEFLDVGYQAVKESDDRNRPLSGDLTDAEKARLAAAGDSLISGGSGVRFLGPGLGRYRQAFDDVRSRTYYRYVGRGQGEYEITFLRIGPTLGDYADSLAGADTVYVYRGPNGGDFAPAGGLTPPTLQSLQQLTARARLGDRGFLSAEAAVSGRDLNTFSPIGDADNRGSAGRVQLHLDPLALSLGKARLGTLQVDGEMRNLGRHFTSFGRLDEAFSYDRDWNLAERGTPVAESRRGGAARSRPRAGGLVPGVGAALSGGGRDADRRFYTLERQGTTFLNATVLRVASQVDTTADRGRLHRETARTGTRWRWLAPSAYTEHEERVAPETGAGRRYRLGGGDLTFGSPGRLSFTVGTEGRDDDQMAAGAGGWGKVSRALTHRASFNVASSQLTATGLYQARDARRPDGTKNRTDLASLDLSRRSRNAAFVTGLHYRVATEGVELRSRALRFVGEGQGSYDAFGNLFPGGGYEIDEGGLKPEELSTNLEMSLRMELDPYRAASAVPPATGLAAVIRRIGWDGLFRVEEQSRLPLGRPSELFRFSNYQKPGSTIHGRIQVHQEVQLFPENRVATIRLQEDLDKIANYQYTNFLEDRLEHLVGAGVRLTPAPRWSADISGRVGRRSQRVSAADGIGRERRAAVTESIGSISFRPRPSTRLTVDATWRREDAGADGGGRSIDLGPKVSQVVGTRGRLDLTARWISASRDAGYTGIGGFSSFYFQDRTELSANGDYRASNSVTIGGGLSARRAEATQTVVDGRMEVRANF